MKIRWLGATLVMVGALMIGSGSFNFNTKEEVIDLGKIKIDKEKEHTIVWPPILGGAFFLGGLAMLAFSRKKRLGSI
ncbi:MAG: hypothetical protein ACK5RG_13585 [Cyclobacteriaceae bacterium]|jgi:hypothetical protein|nr:hypothetical protein [Flammeovirgaceae bacterium]